MPRHNYRRPKKRVGARKRPKKRVSGRKTGVRRRKSKVSGISTGGMIALGLGGLALLYLITQAKGATAPVTVRTVPVAAPVSSTTVLETAGITAAAGVLNNLIDDNS